MSGTEVGAGPVEITVVCAVTRDAFELVAMHDEVHRQLSATGRRVEYLFVLPGSRPPIDAQMSEIVAADPSVRVLRLARDFGEAASLQVGFEHARGKYVLTVPDCRQVDAAVLPEILALLDRGEEVVVVRRDPRSDALFNRLQSRMFHALTRFLVWEELRDITCGVRGLTREVALSLDLYGDQHRFIPILARRIGYDVREIPAPQHAANRAIRMFGPGVYVRRILDILTIFFLARFTRKPLRFFGLIGAVLGVVGFVICAILAVERVLGVTALGDRPLLLLGVLLLVLGVQIASLGLLGEVIIFLSSRRETPRAREITGDRPEEPRDPPA